MHARGSGLLAMLASAITFGMSGTLVKPLLASGWTPAAAVTARIMLAAAVLLVPGLLALRGRWTLLWEARWRILAFSSIAVAGVQLGYFAAVQRIPVGTALLIEYLAPVGLVLLAWVRTRRRPRAAVLAGAAVAVGGLVLVIGPTGGGALDPLGLLFGALASVGVGAYYLLAARADDGVPPVAMIATSLLLGGILLAALDVVGVLPFRATFGTVPIAGADVPWWVPVIAVAVVSTAFAYVAGIVGITRLGERLASFVGLFEVVFASAFAWLLLGEALAPLQLGGAALIVGGVILVRRGGTVAVVPDAALPTPTGSIRIASTPAPTTTATPAPTEPSRIAQGSTPPTRTGPTSTEPASAGPTPTEPTPTEPTPIAKG